MKGQMGIMEYMLMTVFIMVIIVILVFFLSGCNNFPISD